MKELEADGVGRPSTYASILSTIQEREYVRKDGGKFTPTELGMVVTDLLLESFNDLFDVTYTARMEAELDDIEEGKIDWRMAMSEFYERFQKDLEHAERHMTDIKRMEEPTDLICEKCGKPMVIKWGTPRQVHRLHRISGMHQHARARRRKARTEQDEAEYCDNCGRPMVLKKGRFGQFLACSGYPGLQDHQAARRGAEAAGRSARREVPAVRQQAGARSTGASASSWRAAIIPPASTSSRRPSA